MEMSKAFGCVKGRCQQNGFLLSGLRVAGYACEAADVHDPSKLTLGVHRCPPPVQERSSRRVASSPLSSSAEFAINGLSEALCHTTIARVIRVELVVPGTVSNSATAVSNMHAIERRFIDK